MSKKLYFLISFVLVVTLASTSYGLVIHSFETQADIDRWNIICDPCETLTLSSTGVTHGYHSGERTHQGSWIWCEIDLITDNDTSIIAALNNDDRIEVDVSTTEPNDCQHLIVIQASHATGDYYITSPVTWFSSPDGNLATTTVTFEYAPLLTEGPFTGGWSVFRLITNGPDPGVVYYDNLRLPHVQPLTGIDTLMASYEHAEADANDLTAVVDDDVNNSTVVVTWPMLEGTDACSYDPNFGPDVNVPPATDGNCVLGMSWTNEEPNGAPGRVDLHHEWATSTFDFNDNNEIRIDIYIVGPNGVPNNIDLWDNVLGWMGGQGYVVTDEWFTIKFDLSTAANTPTDHNQITTIYFDGVDTNDGKVFFDNLRLWKSVEPKASNPDPRDDTENVQRKPVTISWRAGDYVALHDIYFGTNATEVNEATRSDPVYEGNQPAADCNYPLPLLAADTTYYWRIDEVNTGPPEQIWKGYLWNFTTGKHLAVENLELYTTDTSLRAVWSDYYTQDPYTSAEVYVESTIFHNDSQSMMYRYRNNLDPYYSESRADIADLPIPIGPDWTVGGVKALMLYFYGQAGNDANEQMYVKLVDGDGQPQTATVTYDGDMNDIKKEEWQQWNIALPEFTDVNLANVSRITIGFSHGAGPGGDGTVYFDDILLYSSRCIPQRTTVDLTRDCFIDYEDLDIMTMEWLNTDITFGPNEMNAPDTPVLWYKFDEAAGTVVTDFGTGDHNGTVINPGDKTWDTSGGRDGNGCINLEAGSETYVDVPPAALNFATTTNKISFAAWINGDVENPQDNWNGLFGIRATGGSPPEDGNEVVEVHCPTPPSPDEPNGPLAQWRVGDYEIEMLQGPKAPVSDFAGLWNHYVFTKDAVAGVMQIYHNGQLLVDSNDPNVNGPMFATPVATFFVGTRHPGWGWYIGRVDDFQIYDYVLSPEEAAYLATDGSGFFPLQTPTNLYNVAPNIINFKDFAILAGMWLEDDFWP